MKINTRLDGRKDDELRPVIIKPDYTKYAEGSVLICCGNTKVICTASVEKKVPVWLLDDKKNPKHGWITAEYGMLPRSTGSRRHRETAKIQGRTQEIQRLIGRSLRAVTDLAALGENQISLDCDVLQADGGTRTASITGAFVAMAIACKGLHEAQKITSNPIKDNVAAISLGILSNRVYLDLDYEEDFGADVDLNLVMTGSGQMVEIQGTAEGEAFARDQLNEMLEIGSAGIQRLCKLQDQVIESISNSQHSSSFEING